MASPAPAKQVKSATKPRRELKGHTGSVNGVIGLPGGRRIITCSEDGSLRVWDLNSGTQVGEAWKDNGSGVMRAIALSPSGKKVASGSEDGVVRLWDIDTGKVVKKCMGNTKAVCQNVCWSPDGERVASGFSNQTFRVWDVESGETILGAIETGLAVFAVCYSPDGTMIITGGAKVNVWDANTGELLNTFEMGPSGVMRLAWTSDGETLIAAGPLKIRKFDTATWTEIAVLDGHKELIQAISLSPNERILASASKDKTVRLWNLENNQPIGPPLHHESNEPPIRLAKSVKCAAFSADGLLLASGCHDSHVYTWDVSAIVKDAGLEDLLSDNANIVRKPVLNADATRRRTPAIEGARRIPPGFFDDVPRRVDFSTSRSHHIASPRQPKNPLSWAQNFVSGMLRRRDGLPPIVEVPLTAGKPRNYHARKKTTASSSRPPNIHTTQQPSGATQSNPTSSQLLPTTTTASTTLPPVTGTADAMGTTSRPHLAIRDAGWRARFMVWVCCISVQHTDGQH